VRFCVPTGKVKWYDSEKGFGFLARDDGGEVFMHSSALPSGTTALRPGQRVEFGIAEGRKGAQALQVRLIEPPPTVASKVARKKPDEMVVIVEDLIKLLDGVSNAYRRGKHPDIRDAKKIAAVLRAVADDLEAG
jgi:CspA family cold shock protein